MTNKKLPLIEVEEVNVPSQWARQIMRQANAQGKATVYATSKSVAHKPVVEVYEWPEFGGDQ